MSAIDDKPITIRWKTIGFILSVLFTGAMMYRSLTEEIAIMEAKLSDSELHKMPARIADMDARLTVLEKRQAIEDTQRQKEPAR